MVSFCRAVSSRGSSRSQLSRFSSWAGVEPRERRGKLSFAPPGGTGDPATTGTGSRVKGSSSEESKSGPAVLRAGGGKHTSPGSGSGFRSSNQQSLGGAGGSSGVPPRVRNRRCVRAVACRRRWCVVAPLSSRARARREKGPEGTALRVGGDRGPRRSGEAGARRRWALLGGTKRQKSAASSVAGFLFLGASCGPAAARLFRLSAGRCCSRTAFSQGPGRADCRPRPSPTRHPLPRRGSVCRPARGTNLHRMSGSSDTSWPPHSFSVSVRADRPCFLYRIDVSDAGFKFLSFLWRCSHRNPSVRL